MKQDPRPGFQFGSLRLVDLWSSHEDLSHSHGFAMISIRPRKKFSFIYLFMFAHVYDDQFTESKSGRRENVNGKIRHSQSIWTSPIIFDGTWLLTEEEAAGMTGCSPEHYRRSSFLLRFTTVPALNVSTNRGLHGTLQCTIIVRLRVLSYQLVFRV